MSFIELIRRRPLLCALLACAALAPAVYALTPHSESVASSAATPSRPPLWKVSDKDNTLYLLGSFHLLKPSDYPLSRDVEDAFADSERVVFEVTPEDMADPANAARMQAVAGFNGGGTLSSVLPAPVREKLVARMGEAAYAQLEPFEPWFINLQMTLVTASQMGFKFDQGLDSHLMRRSLEQKKKTSGLESVQSQFKVMDSAPMAEQVAGLTDLLENPEQMPKLLDELHGAWRASDDGKLTALMLQEMRSKTPVSYRQMNVERNQAWLPVLRSMLDTGGTDDTLVVVGALHLLGEDGLVQKLRAKGYTVERVCTGCAARR